MNYIILAFVAYFGVLLTIVAVFYKTNKTEGAFVLGDRSLNYWVTAISAQTSEMGSWLFIGYPAVVFLGGPFEIWTSIGLLAIVSLNWFLIAPRIRVETQEFNSLTLSSYFAARLNDKTKIIKVISALIALFFFIFYISSGFVGLGRMFESVFEIKYFYGMSISLLLAMIYTFLGGFLAVSWCNLFQGILLLFIILFVPIYALKQIGWAAVSFGAKLQNISMEFFPGFSSIGRALLLVAGYGLGYFGQPHILVNYMGIKDPKEIKYAAIVGIGWQTFALIGAILIGLVSIGFFQGLQVNSEHIFTEMCKTLFSPFITGFMLCGILAAILSTVTTQILVATANISEDLYKSFWPKATENELLRISKIGILAITFVSFLVSLSNNDSIYNVVLYAWSGLGASFGPLLILCLYTEVPIRRGGIAGILTGAITSGLWPYFNSTVSPLIPGFFLSFIAIICFSVKE